MRYFGLMLCIVVALLVPGVYAGCGTDTNPYDDSPGTLPNGYYPPNTDFSAEPVSGNAPLVVSFSDRSTNVPTNWAWSFGDGQSSNDKNPVHTYLSPGAYSVSLTAGNGYGGTTVTKSSYVTVNPAFSSPVVDFSVNITSGVTPLVIEFSDLSTGGIIVSRTWTFAMNGIQVSETTTEHKIVHTFSEMGRYNVTLTVTAGNNESASLEKPYYINARQRARQPPPEQGIITLHPGWNLVSTPVPLKEQYRTAGQVFGGIDTDSRSIYSYDAGLKHFITMSSSSVIFPLEGIWVYSKNEVPLTFRYDATRPLIISMHLPSGWNLMGYPSLEPGNARVGYGSINTIWSTILCFDPVTQQYTSTIFNEDVGGMSDQQLMQPLNGYWVYMPQQGDLTVMID